MKHNNAFSKGVIALSAVFALYTATASAHGRWLLPSHTNISGSQAHSVTFDMSISNELFQGHYGFIQASKMKATDSLDATPASLDVIEPNGQWRRDIPFHWFDIKSTGFDRLQADGTYHYVLSQNDVYFVIFKHANGDWGRRFGKLEHIELPEGAQVVDRVRYIPTLHTFVSRNKLTTPTRLNKGLELVAQGHPNDLFAAEQVGFELYFQGKPLDKDIEVQVVKGNTRYRNDRGQQVFALKGTNAFTVTFPEAGMYLVEAEIQLPPSEPGITTERWAVYTTLEVNPE